MIPEKYKYYEGNEYINPNKNKLICDFNNEKLAKDSVETAKKEWWMLNGISAQCLIDICFEENFTIKFPSKNMIVIENRDNRKERTIILKIHNEPLKEFYLMVALEVLNNNKEFNNG